LPPRHLQSTPDGISFAGHLVVAAPRQAGALGILFQWRRPPGAEPNRNVLAAGSGRVQASSPASVAAHLRRSYELVAVVGPVKNPPPAGRSATARRWHAAPRVARDLRAGLGGRASVSGIIRLSPLPVEDEPQTPSRQWSAFQTPSTPWIPRFTASQELKNLAKIRGGGQWIAAPLCKISGSDMMHGERNEN